MQNYDKTAILNVNDIPAKISRVSSYVTVISDKYKERFAFLIEEMESEMGKPIFVSVREANKNPLDVYPMEERKCICTVVMKDEKFKALNGVYKSIVDIQERIRELCVQDVSQTLSFQIEKINGRYIWKCPKCNTYGATCVAYHQINEVPNDPSDRNVQQKCNNCDYDPEFIQSDWLRLTVYPELSMIGTGGGGSVSTIKRLGTLTITK